MNQIEQAKRRIISPETAKLAETEGISATELMRNIAAGRVVILKNTKRGTEKFCAIGKGLRTKINVNLGNSPETSDFEEEERKIEISERYGADAIMDLSVGKDIDGMRRFVLNRTVLPVGTVPIYQAASDAKRQFKDTSAMTADRLFNIIQRHAEDGVDFITVHCGITKKTLHTLKKNPRVMGVVSRGGAILCDWIEKNAEENPLFSQFDRLLDIAYKYDMVLSLGDGMRPGCIKDASDKSQLEELKILALLAKRALKRGVQIIIEGPGHIPIHHIKKNMRWQKKLCKGAPFYVLGPLVTDIAPGYDHITGAIGGALAGSFGADFLCYLTPAEHLRLPTPDDVREGVIASRIAAHAADIAKGIKNAPDWDLAMAKARAARDWDKQIELSVDPDKAKEYRESRKPADDGVCTMCGEFCSLKMMDGIGTTRV